MTTSMIPSAGGTMRSAGRSPAPPSGASSISAIPTPSAPSIPSRISIPSGTIRPSAGRRMRACASTISCSRPRPPTVSSPSRSTRPRARRTSPRTTPPYGASWRCRFWGDITAPGTGASSQSREDFQVRALLFTTGSPFARAVRIVLDELNLDYERREEITTPSVQQRAAATPTLQVPTYWDDDIRLWESGLIAEYLLSNCKERLPTEPPLSDRVWRTSHEWRDKLVFSTIQTLGSAITTISQMKWAGVAVDDNAHLTRSAQRLPHLLGWLEDQLPDEASGFLPGCVSIQDIFLAC